MSRAGAAYRRVFGSGLAMLECASSALKSLRSVVVSSASTTSISSRSFRKDGDPVSQLPSASGLLAAAVGDPSADSPPSGPRTSTAASGTTFTGGSPFSALRPLPFVVPAIIPLTSRRILPGSAAACNAMMLATGSQ